MKPLNFTPFKIDYEAIAKEIVCHYIDTSKYKVFVFGSRARGNHHRFSDLDIGIMGEKPLPISVIGELEDKLHESRIPYKVEVVDFATADEAFKNEAMKKVIWWN
jgi:uncharacterized protein